MARLPNRIHNPTGSGLPSLGTHRQIVGRGLKGKPFYSRAKYHQSKAFRMQQKTVRRIKATSMKGISQRRPRPR